MSRIVNIQNSSRRLDNPIRVRYCADFWNKFRGLMLQAPIDPNGGVLLVEAKNGRMNTSIHMLFMRFDIAAVWINDQQIVVDVQLARRWRLAYLPASPARYILETHVSQAQNFQIGDQVTFTNE